MKKTKYLIVLTLIISLFLVACKDNVVPDFLTDNGVHYSSRIREGRFEVYQDEKWKQINIKSVNLKDSYPNGDTDVSKDKYLEWIELISEMNANTIKIDSLYSPEFYDALMEFNQSSDNKIYLIQSIPMDTSNFVNDPDPFKLDNSVPFKTEVEKTINALHGNQTIINNNKKDDKDKDDEEDSNLVYDSDVSPYVIAYIIGNEWDPDIISYTNNNRLDKEQVHGDYVSTDEAKPFEIFLAEIMEHSLRFEMKEYGWQRPISFLNTPTTDIIEHSYEPESKNDYVSINPDVIRVRNNTGQFATFNVYPYYPDFLNLDPSYIKYIDHRGNANNYSAYIRDLKRNHELPIFIGEFGIPSSRGLSRVSTSNMNKGKHSEIEQGNIISSMYEDLIYQETLGGSISFWQDDWREVSWNINGLDNPDRRQNWSNVQNPMQHFGLLKYEAENFLIDGSDKDWKKNKIKPLYEAEKKDNNKLERVYISHDHEYLYLAIKYSNKEDLNYNALIFLDTISKQGNRTNPFNENISWEDGADFIVHIDGKDNSKILIDSFYDSFYYRNSRINEFLPVNEEFLEAGNEIYNPIRSLINAPVSNENTGAKLPFLDFETGRLIKGSMDEESDEYNSLTDYSINEEDGFLEIRIPWHLLNFTDPSSKEILGAFQNSELGLDEKTACKGIKLAVCLYNKNNPDEFYSLPENREGSILPGEAYTWDNWNELEFNESLKDSYFIIQDTFENY